MKPDLVHLEPDATVARQKRRRRIRIIIEAMAFLAMGLYCSIRAEEAFEDQLEGPGLPLC